MLLTAGEDLRWSADSESSTRDREQLRDIVKKARPKPTEHDDRHFCWTMEPEIQIKRKQIEGSLRPRRLIERCANWLNV